MKSDLINKIKLLKNYISLNIFSFIGYLVFANAIFTIYFVQPILMDTSGLDEMFYGVSYGLYELTLLVINIIIIIIFYFLFKFERNRLKNYIKKYYINYNSTIYILLFYIGYLLFISTFFIYYKSVYIISALFINCIFDITGLSYILMMLD